MESSKDIKSQFFNEKENLFSDPEMQKNSFKLCIRYSLLVEEFIYRALAKKKLDCVLAASGSFSRRELSPFSDIDLMIIFKEVKGNEEQIKEVVALLWDVGVEVSHTVRQFSDISRFLEEDLTSFTQFFETRFVIGDKSLYKEWNEKIFGVLTEDDKKRLIFQYFADIKARHNKFGKSPKILEPNIKSSAGGLRDFHTVEWIYLIKNNTILSTQEEITQTEMFLEILKKEKVVDSRAVNRLLASYAELLRARNLLHLQKRRKQDRFEFADQEKIALLLGYNLQNWKQYMLNYFTATNIVYRFSRTLVKKYEEEITKPISEILSINLDDDFTIKDNILFAQKGKRFTVSEMMRVFYYRGIHNARFHQQLRAMIIESALDVEEHEVYELSSSGFFREILKLPQNVGETLSVMNSLGVLGAFLPEFRELVGFFQPGVYHCYTADEHTLIAIENLEKLSNEKSTLGNLYSGIKYKDILFMSVLLHDIAKPKSISGHEIIGAEISETIMSHLGYGIEDTEMVQFLVKNHLMMEQVAFRRNLNDAETLDNFTALFTSKKALKLLYLLTYADLSAVSPAVWTNWKGDLLEELYNKTASMLDEKLSGEELLYENTLVTINDPNIANSEVVQSHLESIDDVGYLHLYSKEEINEHVREIESTSDVSVFFKQDNEFTNITVITEDSESLLSRLCGALAINDLNIHDAKIFTRKDGIAIDNFNVTLLGSDKHVDESKYEKIKVDISLAVTNELQLKKEFERIKSKWWRIENKFFKRRSKVKIKFESYDKYSIIDIYSPDGLGLLYQITNKMYELGLIIYFAKIATQSDDVVDAFYVLDRNGNKITESDYDFIKLELTNGIEELI